MAISELSRMRFNRFRSHRRGWWSLWILVLAYIFSLLSPWLVSERPLLLSWDGALKVPALFHYSDADLGGQYATEVDYHRLPERAQQQNVKYWTLRAPIPHDPLRAHLAAEGAPPYAPSKTHWLGTDAHGRDMLARLIHGFRLCMSFALLLTLTSTILGVILGGLQGYIGGKFDLSVQRFIEIWSALPFLYVVILVGSIYGTSFWLLLLIMTAFSWIGMSYYMRGEFLRLRRITYVNAARVLGLSGPHIFFREILPNALVPVITLFPFSLIGGITSLTSLDFLGFGLQPPAPSWGELLAQGLQNLYAPWIAIFTVLALFFTLLLATFVGEALRDAFDPKSGDRYE